MPPASPAPHRHHANSPTADSHHRASRRQSVFIRGEHEIGAMSWEQRTRQRVRNLLGGGSRHGEREDSSKDLEAAAAAAAACDEAVVERDKQFDSKKGVPVQYRLETGTLLRNTRSCCRRTGAQQQKQLARYLHWMFRVNFVFLFVVMCTMFFALIIFFSFFIVLAGRMDAQCVRIGGNEFGESDTAFANAFALSWTTFSTVGYGSTYPARGHENESPTNCFFINFVCSLEALVGVLYSGFCGAILFGKVLRVQSHAQVTFSDPIVIRYGMGVRDWSDGMSSDDCSSDGGQPQNRIPCPVLEFRIVNRLHGEVGGEIMDANLNVVANVDANDADQSWDSGRSETVRSVRSVSSGFRPPPTDSLQSSADSLSESGSDLRHDSQQNLSIHSLSGFLAGALSGRQSPNKKPKPSVAVEESTSRLVNKQIFSKMTIEAGDHPFFKRVWLARHVLDEFSPLLKNRVRRQIKRHGGYWPSRLNDCQGIRAALRFNQILVSLNGVSNISASDVYAQRIYDFVDIHVGYQFVNLLYRDTDGSLGVDVDLINDVREQNGGGGEPLILR